MAARFVSSRTGLPRVNRPSRRRDARLLELLFLACALLLGALLAATTLAAPPPTAHARRRDEHRQPPPLPSPVSHHATLSVGAEFGAK
ncbi:MAG TPA: hypothetical protein VGB61_02765 [Pyrinomonadaceae bacterium]